MGKNGLGTTAPNPMVGCVIVHDNVIIGEGYTDPYGSSHAEVNAINNVSDKSLLKKAVLYVTLEPCSHFGKTPPCADMIVAHEIPIVVIGLRDPNEKVAGRGIQALKDAGCEIIVGVLKDECRLHHKRFLTLHEKKRPYIILKWAESSDGFMAPTRATRSKNLEPYWITNRESRQLVHKWRSEEQAILVGTTTVLDDDPKLTVRSWAGKNPIRLVLDRNLKIPPGFNIFDQGARTIICTEVKGKARYKEGIEYRIVNFDENLADQLCQLLVQEEISSVLIEGGARTLDAFVSANLWDEARIFKGRAIFRSGLPAPNISGEVLITQTVATDTLTILKND